MIRQMIVAISYYPLSDTFMSHDSNDTMLHGKQGGSSLLTNEGGDSVSEGDRDK